jgi:hypothetical protein
MKGQNQNQGYTIKKNVYVNFPVYEEGVVGGTNGRSKLTGVL